MFFGLSLHQRTSLYVAVERGNVDIVRYLVDNEADIEKNEDGVSNLLYASEGRLIFLQLFDLTTFLEGPPVSTISCACIEA